MKIAPRKLKKWKSAGVHRSYAEKRNRSARDINNVINDYKHKMKDEDKE